MAKVFELLAARPMTDRLKSWARQLTGEAIMQPQRIDFVRTNDRKGAGEEHASADLVGLLNMHSCILTFYVLRLAEEDFETLSYLASMRRARRRPSRCNLAGFRSISASYCVLLSVRESASAVLCSIAICSIFILPEMFARVTTKSFVHNPRSRSACSTTSSLNVTCHLPAQSFLVPSDRPQKQAIGGSSLSELLVLIEHGCRWLAG